MKPPAAPVVRPTPSPLATSSTSQVDDSFRRWYAQAEDLANTGDYARALRYFQEAAIVCPGDVSVLVYQAVCYIHLGQPSQALQLSETILAIAPDHAQGWLFRGVALQRLGRYPEAYACFARVKPSEPG
ncbi:tetratricopeptide repeat protein [Leptolyngbya sp. KIOST-1]|uniref:tetratricopeptide repeat protein n=1 Tax=Leptolyngbya sp. KIOST-1 TaxID=1229172 RepID=UPI000691C226|nr:tetratricopeptide repeat protein [Leptolyngbya sp. KIOST-1]